MQRNNRWTFPLCQTEEGKSKQFLKVYDDSWFYSESICKIDTHSLTNIKHFTDFSHCFVLQSFVLNKAVICRDSFSGGERSVCLPTVLHTLYTEAEIARFILTRWLSSTSISQCVWARVLSSVYQLTLLFVCKIIKTDCASDYLRF